MKKNTTLIIAIILIIVSLYIFSQFGFREMMGNSDGEYGTVNMEAINRKCQTEYLSAVRDVLTGPTIDPKSGYITNKDVLIRVNAVNNTCQWNNNTPIEKQYQKFKKVLSDNSDTNQINNLLIAIS
jgi:hypothetical protein